jgi:hypothetical protein
VKVYCEYGDHNVNEEEIDIGTGYTICKSCMKEVEEERVKKVEQWFGMQKATSWR